MLIVLLSCAWLAGIFIGSRVNLSPWLFLAGILPMPLLFFARGSRRPLVLACLSVLVIIGAAIFSYSSLHAIDSGQLRFYNDRRSAEIRGMVAASPDVRGTNTRLTLEVDAIKLEGEWKTVSGRALLYVPVYPAYRYGDVLRVTGEPETPPRLDDFDYRDYLSHQGINTIVFFPGIEVLDTGRGFPPLAGIYSLRDHLARALAEVLPEPQASLAQGIVLGIRASIPADLKDDFSRSGTSHVLAISGFNLTIMAGILLSVGLWLFGRKRYFYVWLALGCIWFYTIITGLSPPVVRGAIMVSLFLVAEFLGRQRSAIVALALAAAIMAGLHPYILGDASFQLSFLAMAGLIFISPLFSRLGRRWFALSSGTGTGPSLAVVTIDIMAATLGAITAVWPLVAHYFGIVSLIGPLATFLALPALPGIIIFGAAAGALGIIVPILGQAFGWLAWPFLSYLLLVVEGMAAPAFSALDTGVVNPALLCIYYPVLVAVIWAINRKTGLGRFAGTPGLMKSDISLSSGLLPKKRWVVAPLLVLAAVVTGVAASLPDARLRVSFLDVGEGDAILIQQGNRQVLVDGGPDPRDIDLALGSRMPFWDRSLDLLVLTHPHQDHLAGLVEVLRRYKVGQVLCPDIDYSSPLYDEWQRLLDEKKVRVTTARAGQQISLGDGVIIRVISPPAELRTGGDSDIDNNGIILRLTAGQVSFLMTADIMEETERALVRERAGLAATVLKAAHHGSVTSSTPGFLAVVSPRVAVISCGAGNKFGHPDDLVTERLANEVGLENIYRTDTQGTVDFVTDGDRLWVDVER
ncbi:MAG: DNA internalization-related competence protein ComEC/Rec2 [Chloroflexi bacterium RBG_16_56_11]|nr:MAG: DNA internalization-related competence protein ComEC/Rec2 [Chloroflexi bacterium RBG_16_56_11]